MRKTKADYKSLYRMLPGYKSGRAEWRVKNLLPRRRLDRNYYAEGLDRN